MEAGGGLALKGRTVQLVAGWHGEWAGWGAGRLENGVAKQSKKNK